MNGSKAAVSVIILCLIVPMLIGFVWPAEQSESTVYDVVNGRNLTNEMNKPDAVPVFSEFTDLYSNNASTFRGTHSNNSSTRDLTFDVHGISYTYNENAIPKLVYQKVTKTIMADSDGLAELGNFKTYALNNNPFANDSTKQLWMVVLAVGTFEELDFNEGEVAQTLIWYSNNDVVQFITPDRDWLEVIDYIPDVSLSGRVSQADSIYLYYYYYNVANPEYVNLENGLRVPAYYADNSNYSGQAVWFNGYENKSADLIFKITSNFNVNMILPGAENYNGSHVYNIRLKVDAQDNIVLSSQEVDHNVTKPTQSVSLGSYTKYPYVLVRFNGIDHTFDLCGLPYLTNFMDDYRNKISTTVSIEDVNITTFRYFSIRDTVNGSSQAWLVPRTVSAVTTTSGLMGFYDLRAWDVDNFEVEFRNIMMLPDDTYNPTQSLSIGSHTVNNPNLPTYFDVRIIDGYAHVTGNVSDEELVLPMKNLKFTVIGNDFYLNGIHFAHFNEYQSSISFYFYQPAVMNVILSDLKTSSVESYGWVSGNFGLSEHGYCMVGLITAVLSGLAGLLAGRRSGERNFIVLFTSGICGAVYLIILMAGF